MYRSPLLTRQRARVARRPWSRGQHLLVPVAISGIVGLECRCGRSRIHYCWCRRGQVGTGGAAAVAGMSSVAVKQSLSAAAGGVLVVRSKSRAARATCRGYCDTKQQNSCGGLSGTVDLVTAMHAASASGDVVVSSGSSGGGVGLCVARDVDSGIAGFCINRRRLKWSERWR